MTESYIFDLSSHIIVKHGNITKEITRNDKKMYHGCCMQSFEQKNIVCRNILLS